MQRFALHTELFAVKSDPFSRQEIEYRGLKNIFKIDMRLVNITRYSGSWQWDGPGAGGPSRWDTEAGGAAGGVPGGAERGP